MDGCCGEMAGAVNTVDRCVIYRFIICSRAVYSATIQRKISSRYALCVTNERICDSWMQRRRTYKDPQREADLARRRNPLSLTLERLPPRIRAIRDMLRRVSSKLSRVQVEISHRVRKA
jgi:hypothetical protein